MYVYAQCAASYAFNIMFTHQLHLHHAQISYAQWIQICTHTKQKYIVCMNVKHTISCHAHTHIHSLTHTPYFLITYLLLSVSITYIYHSCRCVQTCKLCMLSVFRNACKVSLYTAPTTACLSTYTHTHTRVHVGQ